MEIGFNAPTARPLAEADALIKICVGGEAMGFDFATFSDHVVIPSTIGAPIPIPSPVNSLRALRVAAMSS